MKLSARRCRKNYAVSYNLILKFDLKRPVEINFLLIEATGKTINRANHRQIARITEVDSDVQLISEE